VPGRSKKGRLLRKVLQGLRKSRVSCTLSAAKRVPATLPRATTANGSTAPRCPSPAALHGSLRIRGRVGNHLPPPIEVLHERRHSHFPPRGLHHGRLPVPGDGVQLHFLRGVRRPHP